MFKTLNQLLQEKANVESKIRAVRVTAIRAEVANLVKKGVQIDKSILKGLDKINNMVEKIHYNQTDFDNLLDLVEDQIEDIL